MDILGATAQYEKWMAARIRVVKEDLAYKHEQMRESPFAFLRATFYRWIQLWKEFCETEASAPAVLAVGDLHIENFGTWRDSEGRLIWGINDFDEAFPLPYTFDLVRLGSSARLAIKLENLTIGTLEACDAILEGYTEAIRSGGRPFVLDEEHVGLPRKRDEARILHAMGFETANVHLGSPEAIKAIRHDLDKRPARWLYKKAKRMVKAVESDWRQWRNWAK